MDAGQLNELALYYSHLSETLRALAGSEDGERLAAVVRQHLNKQRAYEEYVRLIPSATAGSISCAMFNDAPTDRRLLVECFQGVDLRYSPSRCPSPLVYTASPPASPSCRIGPSL